MLKLAAYTAMFGAFLVYAGIVRLASLKDPARTTSTVATVLIGAFGIALGAVWLMMPVWLWLRL